MTTETLAEQLNLTVYCKGKERNVGSFYACDLLSWVMGRAGEDCCWLTIMSNLNVAGVANVIDASCVLLCEGVQPDNALLERMVKENVCLVGTRLSVFDAAKAICALNNK